MVGWDHPLNEYEFGLALELVWTGRPGVQQSVGSQRIGHDLVTELS